MQRAGALIGGIGTAISKYWQGHPNFDTMTEKQWLRFGEVLHANYSPKHKLVYFGSYKPDAITIEYQSNPNKQEAEDGMNVHSHLFVLNFCSIFL